MKMIAHPYRRCVHWVTKKMRTQKEENIEIVSQETKQIN